ncbi:MAG: peptidoglycan DD-metalloendopeptidase family protein [Actinobacteria bacterium]|nr:peptidoglycan DD-metalloendopeptidase family protein [Actinomycetota bacterium]
MLKALFALSLTLLLGALGGGALAADPEAELDRTRSRLGEVRERKGVLTGELQAMGAKIADLRGQIGATRTRERRATVALLAKQEELAGARDAVRRAVSHLSLTKSRLRRALKALRERVVAIYEAGTPDMASIILAAHDYEEAADVAAYLERIEQADEALITRVRGLRDEAREAVDRRTRLRGRITAARDAIAARRASLRTTRIALADREASLRTATADRRRALASLADREAVLEGDVSDLQAQIEAELAAAAGPYPTAPRGAGGTFVWPVEGTLTSSFGYRWGRQHEGVDIGAAEGTPIWAAADGTVVLQQPEYESGGYGNYTCIEHDGVGLTTCYAHQSAFEVSPGQRVAQGQVIGLVGNTGNSFGAHLHFEVRAGGVAQDPLAFL